MWALVAVGAVAVIGAAAGAYLGLHGARGAGGGPGAVPPARAYAAMAYDEASHTVVLFGGVGQDGSALGDTWTWDGSSWTQQHPAVSPPARAFAALAYDPHGHDVILVGGRTVRKPSAVACWQSASSGGVVVPGAPAAHGPVLPSGTPSFTTTAVLAPPSMAPGAPPKVPQPPLSVPPAEIVIPSPCPAATTTQLTDTWIWDGSGWRTAGLPAPADLTGGTATIGSDPTTGQLLLMTRGAPAPVPLPACPAPAPGSSQTPVACPGLVAPDPTHEFSWNGSGWTALSAPLPSIGAGIPVGGPGILVSDPVSGHLADFRAGANIVCGTAPPAGASAACPLNEGSVASPSTPGAQLPTPAAAAPTCCAGSVAVWTGSRWSQAATFSTGPSLLQGALVGDPAHHQVVALTLQGTWTWDGSAWSQRHPSRAPAPTAGGTIAYDGASHRVLFFGGQSLPAPVSGSMNLSAPPPVSSALWAWDGATWTLLDGTAPPTPTAAPTPTPATPPPATSTATALPAPPASAPTGTAAPSPTSSVCTPAAGAAVSCVVVSPSPSR